ncbi:hypothetical protein, partial [Gardnerella greenwoodii]|uniref:hypothetical protein n=1 Tax=Gardnerella greenwoodii TaxID=2914925 RepID=UPI000517DCF0
MTILLVLSVQSLKSTMKTEYILIEKERFTKNREKKRQEIVYSQEFKEKTKAKKDYTRLSRKEAHGGCLGT